MKLHFLVLYFIASFTCRSALSYIPPDPFLGIPPQDVKYYYKSSSGGGDVIECKNGSKTFTRAQLNDDFCDCPDASDEPGTSACPNGKFHCQNAGHVSLSLFSSRVNDGICDCCDGSDEYDGKVKCPNTCWEAGKVARDKLKKKIATYQEGVTIRKREIELAKLAIAKDETELETLKNDEKILKGLVQQLKERKEQIEKVEEEERLQREKEKAKKEEEEKVIQDKENEKVHGEEENPTDITNDDKFGTSEDSPIHKEVEEDYVDTESEIVHIDDFKNEGSLIDATEKHAVESEEVSADTHKTDLNVVSEASSDHHEKQEKDKHENNEALSKEELGRLVASRWTGENTGQETGDVHTPQIHDHEGHEEPVNDRHDDEHEGYASDSDSEKEKYEDNDTEDQIEEDLEEDHDESGSCKPDFDEESDLSDITSPSESSWLEKIQQTVRNIIDSVNFFKAPANISDAAHVRKEYDDSSSKLSEIESKISSLTRKLKQDFGLNKEFYSFYDRCFESKHNKYVYKVCPYKQASQEEGHRTTRLGRWDKFEDSHRAMLFSNGEGCWNGPDRSLKVKLRCGLSNEVADVDEPSRCEYVALLSTPAFCHEEKLKELHDELDLMNKELPQSHDEL